MEYSHKIDQISERIYQIMQSLCNGNNVEFASKIGKDTTYTSQLCNGSKKPGQKMLEQIASTFPEVSRIWLVLGEGPMMSADVVGGINTMGLPILKLVYDRNKRASSTKEGAIELRITYNRISRFATTGIRVLPRQWKNGCIVNRLDAFEMQHSLDVFTTRARRVISDQMEAGTFDMSTIVSIIVGKQKQESSENIMKNMLLVDYFRDRAKIRKYGRKGDSQARYDRFINWFEQWGGMLTFEDLTQLNILNMDEALRSKPIPSGGEMSVKARWNNYHRFLNSFIIDAIEDGILKTNPYKRLNIERGEDTDALERHLTPEEFAKLENTQFTTEYLNHAKDLFVFQTYTGMAYCDLEAFEPSLIRYENGRPMYSDKRNKTGQQFTFMLMEPAMAVLEKYGGRLPMMSNQKYNQQLKNIAMIIGLNKPLSSHWARHTCACMLLNQGVEMEVIAHVLGHSSTRMTRSTYAKMFDTTIVDAMKKVEKKIISVKRQS